MHDEHFNMLFMIHALTIVQSFLTPKEIYLTFVHRRQVATRKR